MKSHNNSLGFVGLACCLVLTLCSGSYAASGYDEPAQRVGQDISAHVMTGLKLAAGDEDRAKKYHWLFREHSPEEPVRETESATVLEKLDREIKLARKVYLSGETDNGILKYRSVVDLFESIVDDIPPGHPLLNEMEQRFSIFDELATKILGPVDLEPREDLAGQVFHLMEKRRICRRNLTLKKAGVLAFFDVPTSLLKEESEILKKLLEIKEDVPTSDVRQTEATLKTKLAQVRKSLQRSSPRYELLRRGTPPPLGEVCRELLGKDEMILDFNLFSDRMVLGVITTEKGIYYQVPVNRAEIDKGVFQVQEKLREFTTGERSSFMGHAWKEPCRRIYRTLLGKLTALPSDKSTFFVIPDRSLWYLPLSAMLDAEDRPFGRDRLVSVIPSVDMLRFARSSVQKKLQTSAAGDLLLFESLPWIAEDDVREGASSDSPGKKVSQKTGEEEKIERLILTNPVYPKPSEIVISIQKMFKKFDVWVGPTATAERLLEYKDKGEDVTVLAVPLAMTDTVGPDHQPSFFFAPDKRGRRKFKARGLFVAPVPTSLMLMPISWFDAQDLNTSLGEGPLLLSTAMSYAGVRMGLLNYSDPNWGPDDPFVLGLLKKVAEKTLPGEALAGLARDIPAGLDASFSGKPPSWTGWILMGDPGR
ncbi:MAG: CHAT domain-containing protein [Desulfomonilaceae bacterium]